MIKVTICDNEGIETEHEFPSKKEVCPECGGEGFVLCEGMRGYAYSAEEFNEAFHDDEDRAEYFRRGGKYDQRCPCCQGKNVIDVPDESNMSAEQKVLFAQWEKYEAEAQRMLEDDRRTMRMECGMWD